MNKKLFFDAEIKSRTIADYYYPESDFMLIFKDSINELCKEGQILNGVFKSLDKEHFKKIGSPS